MLGARLRAWALAPAVVGWVGLGVAAGPRTVRADSPPAPDHLTLLEALAGEAARDVVTQLALAPGTAVHLVPETEHPANWLAQRALARSLTESGCQVILRPFEGRPTPVAPPQAAAPSPQPRLLPGSQTPPATGERQGVPATGDEEPSEPDSAAVAGERGAEPETGTGEEQTPAGGELPAVVQQRRQERLQREAEEQARRQAEAAAAQTEASPAPVEVDLTRALPAEGEVVLYRVAELEVSYPWIKRSWVVGPRRYGRLATVRLRASHLTQPGLRVGEVAQGDRIAIDEFPGWARSYLEGPQYPFAISQPEQKSMQRYVEPVFVAAVVSGLVYLFYENQK